MHIRIMVLVLMAGLSQATAQTNEGYRVLKSKHTFAELQDRIKNAAELHKMAQVTRASASDGAKASGVVIKGDAVIGIFRNDFARRVLSANIDAGIEAPIRLHLVEEPDGTSTVRYYSPTSVFGNYTGSELKLVATELDAIISAIVQQAVE
jgi:uncharacterized protein (DUF302 family)